MSSTNITKRRECFFVIIADLNEFIVDVLSLDSFSVAAMGVKMSCPHSRIRCFKRNIRERRLRRAQRCGEAAISLPC